MSADELIHDREAIRNSDDPDVTRIVRRVGAALNIGRDAAVVAVVLDEVERANEPMSDDDMLAELVKRGVLVRETAEETVEALERWVSLSWRVVAS